MPAFFSALRAEVDDPIGRFNDVEMMLDHQNGIAQVHKFLQHIEQLADVVEMKPGGRLIEDVESPAGLALAEFASQLDALRLAAGERGGGLAQVDVAQPDVVQRLPASRGSAGCSPSAAERVFDGGLQQVGNGDGPCI